MEAIVVIPAQNEAERIRRCLAALAVQRDQFGAPVASNSFRIVVLANNCTDRTAEVVRALAPKIPQPVRLVEMTLASSQANAGWARKTAMDCAAAALDDHGVVLTTDADSFVQPDWFDVNMQILREGADCVAGYIDADPLDYMELGSAFAARGRLEDSYLRLVAEIYALCDPRPHDPWPNHRVASGASIAVRVSAYRAVGGLPPRPLGEDIAFIEILERRGFKVRHAMNVAVTTSCRLDGRAKGGAADTMRLRRDLPEAECDAELEPALATARRAIARGRLRQAWKPLMQRGEVLSRWKLRPAAVDAILSLKTFEDAWLALCQEAANLQRGRPLRPADLPRQIAIARMVIAHLRAVSPKAVRGDSQYRAELHEQAAAALVPV